MRLSFRPPLDAAGLLRFLGLRAVPGVEEVEGTVYRRTVRLGRAPAVIALDVRPGDVRLAEGGEEAAAVARRLLDLDADPAGIDGVLAADPVLAPLVAAAPGRRLPGTADPFELAVRAVLGQQITVVAARGLAARIVAAGGPPLPAPAGTLTHLFPSPEDLLRAPEAAFPMPAARREALRGLARAAAADPAGWLERDALLALSGIGPWTAGYVAMRALGDRDAFLPTDVGVRAGLRALGIDASRSDRWRPYRAHAMLHLWDAAHTAPPARVARS